MRRCIGRDHGLDPRRQEIGDAAAFGALQRQAHVAGMHTKAQTLAQGFRALRDQHFSAGEGQPGEVVVGVVAGDLAFHHDAGVLAEGGRQVKSRQGFAQFALGDGPSLFQQHHVIGQPRHFVRRVADVEHRDIQLVMQAFQVGQDLALALEVERSQRFVHQQQARAGQQRAGDADTLALAAGKTIRHALQQMVDAQQFHRLLQHYTALRCRHSAHAEFQITSHRQVGEQVGVLEHISDGATVRWHEQVLRVVLPVFAVDAQLAAARAFQPGDAAQQGGLAGA